MYARDTALIATPIGMIRIQGSCEAIETLTIEERKTNDVIPGAGAVAEAARQLRDWFSGMRRSFDLPLAPSTTARGQALRAGMIAIPYGETTSYGALAASLGSGARAVGQACARNPLPIIVPCHRVLEARGALGHYSGGGGSKTKAWLLDHERRHCAQTLL